MESLFYYEKGRIIMLKDRIQMTSRLKRLLAGLMAASVFATGFVVGGNVKDGFANNAVGVCCDSITLDQDENIVELNEDFTVIDFEKLTDRDYSVYGAPARRYLSGGELSFYDRLNERAMSYLVGNETAVMMSSRGAYAMDGIEFADLGLDEIKAYQVFEYFFAENPQYYFLRPKFYNNSTTCYVGMYDIFAYGKDRSVVTEQLFDLVDTWRSSVRSDMSDYDKVSAISYIVSDKLSYENNVYDQTVYSAVCLGKTVCYGYATLFSMLCNASGVECMVMYNAGHAWNIVKVDGQWYISDATYCDAYRNNKYIAIGELDYSNQACAYCKLHSPAVSSVGYASDSDIAVKIMQMKPINFNGSVSNGDYSLTWSTVFKPDRYVVEIYSLSGTLLQSLIVYYPIAVFSADIVKAGAVIKVQSLSELANCDVIRSEWAVWNVEATQTSDSSSGGSSALPNQPSSSSEPVVDPVIEEEPVVVDFSNSVPTGLSVVRTTNTQRKISWDVLPEASGYNIQIGYTANFKRTRYNTTLRTTGVIFNNIGSGYYIRVRGYKMVNGVKQYSAWSDCVAT